MPPSVTDKLLQELSRYSPEFGGGFSCHAPMTMLALTRIFPGVGDDRLVSFVRESEKRLQPWPANVKPIDVVNHGDALGDHTRLSDWRDYFIPLFAEGGWREPLAEWAPRLFPGVMAGATHGLIRTAYAVDYLLEEDTPERRGELAIAMAYWASRFQALPDTASGPIGADASVLLGRIERLPEEMRVKGLIFNRVGPLEGFAPFHPVRGWLDVSHPVSALNGVSAAAASLYIQNDGRPAITFIHCLTATHAVRMLSRALPENLLPEAVAYLWQAVAGLYCADSDTQWENDREPDAAATEGWDRMLARAASVNTDHVVKYAWSTFEENRANPNPVYAAALARWLYNSGLAL